MPKNLQGRWLLLRIATDPRCQVSLADLRDRHTILDVLDLHEVLDLGDSDAATP